MKTIFTIVHILIFSTTAYFLGRIDGDYKAFKTLHNKTTNCLDRMTKDIDNVKARGNKLFGTSNRTWDQIEALVAYELHKCMEEK